MLKQAALNEVKEEKISKANGYLVIATRYYPQFFPRDEVHEYINVLAPSKMLLQQFKALEKKLKNHDLAFAQMEYEKKFSISTKAYEELKRLSELSKKVDVYLVCYCQRGQCCHRELLLMMAQKFFNTAIEQPARDYPIFADRLNSNENIIKD